MYYTLNEAINSKHDPINQQIFIIANETQKRDGTIGRNFIVLRNFELFMKNRHKLHHCHELFIDHINNKPNNAGRLVFDFDIKYSNDLTIPEDFKEQIEDTIFRTIKKFYINVDIELFDFVWSTC